MVLLHVILIVLFAYFAFNVGYLLLFAIAGLFRKATSYPAHPIKHKIALLIPAYKEDNVIIDTTRRALEHDYPSSSFEVIVIADRLKPATLEILAQMPVRLHRVAFENSTKAKSLKSALNELSDDFDIAMILDADNVMAPGCLERINSAFHRGARMVQLHRTAKNKNTSTAVMDGLSEEINNHIFRKGHRALGLSSTLIGSGMAFDYTRFKELMLHTDIENIPGEDREINLEMLKMGIVCEYIEGAYIFDEKVQSNIVLEKQRTRWLSAQMQYARRFWGKEFLKTFSYNIHYFDYAVQTLLLPRVLLLTATLLITLLFLLLAVLFGINLLPDLLWWTTLFFGTITVLFISAHSYFLARTTYKALLNMPKILVYYIRALLKSRSDQQSFIHTPKEFVKD